MTGSSRSDRADPSRWPARALVRHSTLDAPAIAREAMAIAAGLCIYTNANLTIEEL
jgi:ATP-dependent HslUV protease subunit HslV